MEPIHAIEYELTSELATDIERALLRHAFRRGWRRDVPRFVAAAIFAGLIVWLGLGGWVLPGVAGALLAVLTLFVMGAVWRRWSLSRAAAFTALLPLHTSDRRVRLEFAAERVRLETEFFRGEGAWSELDEVVIFPGFWVLWLTNGGLIVAPSALVSPELDAFIRVKADLALAPVRPG